MTILVLSSTCQQTLKKLISIQSQSQSSNGNHQASILPDNLLNQLSLAINPKLDIDSPADPSIKADDYVGECRVDSKCLIQLASWARNEVHTHHLGQSSSIDYGQPRSGTSRNSFSGDKKVEILVHFDKIDELKSA